MNRSEPKRTPTLADQLLGARMQQSMSVAWQAHARTLLQTSKRFVLDAQAAAYLAEMIQAMPRVIADAGDFAIAPFERMWIEMPFVGFWEKISGRVSAPGGDLAVGYLFDGPVVKVAAMHRIHGGVEAGWNPTEYILHRPMSPQEQARFCQQVGMSRFQLNLHMWGESARALIGPGPEAPDHQSERPAATWGLADPRALSQDERHGYLRALRDAHTVRLADPKTAATKEGWDEVLLGSQGDLRIIIALLLYLNRTQEVQLQREVGWGGLMTGRDRRPRRMAPHRVISLRMDPMPVLRKLVAGQGATKRLHDVRGHFAHDKLARAGCMHGIYSHGDLGDAWIEYDVNRWRCELCGGRRWWQPAHSRGSLEAGVVGQSYAVTR